MLPQSWSQFIVPLVLLFCYYQIHLVSEFLGAHGAPFQTPDPDTPLVLSVNQPTGIFACLLWAVYLLGFGDQKWTRWPLYPSSLQRGRGDKKWMCPLGAGRVNLGSTGALSILTPACHPRPGFLVEEIPMLCPQGDACLPAVFSHPFSPVRERTWMERRPHARRIFGRS